MDCFRCGTCCIAPDISTLSKPLGVPCSHLSDDRLCRIYHERPPICRHYQPDDICRALQELTPTERVAYYLKLFDMGE